MIVVLAYHSISERQYTYSVTPADFERQMAFLKRKATILSLDQLYELLDNLRDDSKRLYALVTFDDGVSDLKDSAVEVVNRLQIPITIFIPTGLAGTVVTGAGGVKSRLLNWEEMREMGKNSLVQFESHTHTHPLLDLLEEEKISFELQTSQTLIEKNLGKKTNYLSYPKGRYNSLVKKIAGKFYRLSFGPDGAIYSDKGVDKFSLPRVVIRRGLSFWRFRLLFLPLFWQVRKIFR